MIKKVVFLKSVLTNLGDLGTINLQLKITKHLKIKVSRKALKTLRLRLEASHTLYPMEQGTSFRHIWAALGHNSSKAAEIYTRVLTINNKKTKIILDIIQKSVNLVCNMK